MHLIAGMYFSPNFATMVQKVLEVWEGREFWEVILASSGCTISQMGAVNKIHLRADMYFSPNFATMVQKVLEILEDREFWEVILVSSGCTISQTGAVPFRGRR